MEKIICGLWRDVDADVDALQQALFYESLPLIMGTGAPGVRVLAEDPAAAAMRYNAAPDGQVLAGSVGVWVDSIDHRQPILDALALTGATTHAYLVTESVPLAYQDRTWAEGERSPGVAILTFFHQQAGLTDDEFFAVWHGVQTPLTFELHPVTVYMRNAVARALTPGAPAFRGIVEESVPTLEDLLDFDRFYSAGGDKDELRRRMTHSMEVHERFTDMATMEMVPCFEHIFRTVST